MQKLKLFIVRKLIPTEPKARKKFIKALFPGKHLHGNPKGCLMRVLEEEKP